MEHTLSGKVPLPPIGKKPKGLFSINGWNLPFLPRLLVWLGAAQVKSTSFWPLRADPCLIPCKTKSVGQSALSCSSHNSYSKPPLWGGTLQKTDNSIRAGAVRQITRPLVSNPNGSSKSGEETQQHGRKTNSVHRREILEDNTAIKPEQKHPEQERNRQMIKEFRD